MLHIVKSDIIILLNNIFLEVNKRNKDPCYGLKLLYLRI